MTNFLRLVLRGAGLLSVAGAAIVVVSGPAEAVECAAFEAQWAPGTMQRRCYTLAP